jgi:hypothetical protein
MMGVSVLRLSASLIFGGVATLVYGCSSTPLVAQGSVRTDSSSFVVIDDSTYLLDLDSAFSSGGDYPPDVRSNVHFALRLVSSDLNALYSLPSPVQMRGAWCGRPNAFYDPAARRITVCYELDRALTEAMAQAFPDSAVQGLRAIEALFAAIAHEAGHALVGVLRLPALGRQEDVADQYAVAHMLEFTATRRDAAIRLHALQALAVGLATLGQNEVTAAAEAHPLGLQRAANVACWVAGYARLHGVVASELEGSLPEGRRNQCPDEYKDMVSAWQRLLEPYWKRLPGS